MSIRVAVERLRGTMVTLSMAAWALFATAHPCGGQTGPGCAPANVVIDGTPPDTLVGAFDGRGYGQVIAVTATRLAAIRFEMPETLASYWSQAILYVMSVDANGRPDVVDPPIYISQVIGPPPDIGQDPTPLVFVFDPPMVLPGIGRYFFDVNENACLGDIRLLGNRTNAYTGGGAWKTAPSNCDGRGPGGVEFNDSQLDLLCEITYCDLATPVVRRTWGAVKQIFR